MRACESSGPPTGPAGGDLAGTYPDPTVVAIEETGDPARLAIGVIPDMTLLARVGASVVGVPAPASLPPSGPAGGDLDGNYPDPTVVAIEETGDPARLVVGAIPNGTYLKRVGAGIVGVLPTPVIKEWGVVQNSGASTQRYLSTNIITTNPSLGQSQGTVVAPVSLTFTTLYVANNAVLATDTQTIELYVESGISTGVFNASGLLVTLAVGAQSGSATGSVVVAAGRRYVMGYKQSGTEAANANLNPRASLAGYVT